MELIPHRPRLLLIEDNPDTRQIYKDVFERDGFEVLQAEDGEKGLSYAQSTLPDIILLDLMLPKLNGFDLLKRLRAEAETEKLPVVIFSAVADASDRKKAAELGVTEFSVKATNTPKQVLSRVRAVLEQARHDLLNSASKSFTLLLKETFEDAAQLQAQVGIVDRFRCPQCQEEVVLTMHHDPTRSQGHWYAAHLVCSGCQRGF